VFLKSVELFGFKSFADRSRIEFRDGVSALLGPNGCGKSNVVDAIKWVLGEQSTKTLRAEKMEDVIFNGTESRKALSVAEVALTLSNDKGLLPLDLPEIEIKRRVYRSGESEYYLNNAQVRLKEIRELFYDTGIGKSAYSIMEQGRIDQILSNKPEERRYIFEEAAGITRFKVKGQEAERKLAKTEENMRQVESILSEVERSYNSLKKQSDKTLEYRKLKDEIFEVETEVYLLRLKGFLESKHEKEQGLDKRIKERQNLKDEIDGINDSLEENLDMVNSMETNLIESQKRLYGIDLEKSNCETQIKILKERQGELGRQLESDRHSEKVNQEKLASIETEIGEKEKILVEMGERISEIGENIGSFTEGINTARYRIGENDKQINRLEAEIRDIEKAREILTDRLRKITDDIVKQLDQKLEETGYSYQERERLEEEIRTSIEETGILLTGKEKILHDRAKEGIDRELAASITEAVSHSAQKVLGLKDLFSKYSQSVPSFLDDFLAPEGIITQKREIDEELSAGRKQQEENREAIQGFRKENSDLAAKIEDYRKTLEDLRMNQVRMNTQKKGLEDTVKTLQGSIGDMREQIERIKLKIDENLHRLKQIDTQIEELKEKKQNIIRREEDLKKELAKLETTISTRNKDLLDKEKKLKRKMDDLGNMQSKIESVQMNLAEMNAEIRNIYANFSDHYSRELSEFEDRMYEIKTPFKELKDRLQEKKSGLKALGHVNLMAPEEFEEVKERYEFLNGQLADLKKAREDLERITEEIRTESTEQFLGTYDKIRKNFHLMFRRLFGGGRAEIRLSEPDTVLESGIDILAQPPGKSLENIALLSGGERSLTAIALLFATYMVKPSPFTILDEIDAALDEANVNRFVNTLMEFANTSQFIVITHNKKTVTGARTLLGVTMEESGVSKIISIRLSEEPEEARA
jgi:chromosome segregation protein